MKEFGDALTVETGSWHGAKVLRGDDASVWDLAGLERDGLVLFTGSGRDVVDAAVESLNDDMHVIMPAPFFDDERSFSRFGGRVKRKWILGSMYWGAGEMTLYSSGSRSVTFRGNVLAICGSYDEAPLYCINHEWREYAYEQGFDLERGFAEMDESPAWSERSR